MTTRREWIRSHPNAPTRYPFGRLWDQFERRIIMPGVVVGCLLMLFSVLTGLRG